jgi:hypothetical protein
MARHGYLVWVNDCPFLLVDRRGGSDMCPETRNIENRGYATNAELSDRSRCQIYKVDSRRRVIRASWITQRRTQLELIVTSREWTLGRV